ncbi:hypothetical protein [Hymenobacter sp. YC55]|uniref:hypothetical protein n=1 Tax=Hymenobacter sp. YC55 TaxID=3034019 RepID=UPI0023F90670|nr:hypothetical protein [Hymenobacter sp. YC55]MDF7811486.1 hypothetical protein [Hymenobacter sp. YC55]
MPASHNTFCALPLRQQMHLVWTDGTFMAARRLPDQVVALYCLYDFFCEVCYDHAMEYVLRTHSFSTTPTFDDYADPITLNDLLDLES